MSASPEALPSYSSKLHGKRILVIGGTSGIGFAVASAAYDHGAHVIVSSSSSDRVSRAVERITKGYADAPKSSSVRGFACDLADISKTESQLQALLDDAARDGPLDHIAFTAGDKLSISPLTDTSVEQMQQCGVVRFIAPLLLSKLILQRNQEGASGGQYLALSPDSSLTFTSGSAHRKSLANGWAVVAGYAAGIEGSMRALAKELKPIRVNVVTPGAVETELFASLPDDRRGYVMDMFKNETTTGRVGRPQDLAESYLYCMRDGFFTGSVIGSDGGRLI